MFNKVFYINLKLCYYIRGVIKQNYFALLISDARKEGKLMSKNQKVKEIEKLFEGGDIDYTSLEDFLKKETFKLYNLLEIRSRDNHVIKFKNNKEKSFLEVIDSKGNIIIYNCKIENYGQIEFLFKNTKISKINLQNKKFYLYHICY